MANTGEEAQREVMDLLADPATHGLAAGAVTRIRTHAAEVFLAGDRAYKVKRAVRYAFLDFTALEDRRAACEAEIRLNARTAPEIYLGVVAVRRGPGGRLALDPLDAMGEGEVVEWCVVMRRFDENLTFDKLAERGELKDEWMVALADAMIALHDGAEVRSAPFGGSEGLAEIIEENAEDMAGLEDILPPARVGALIEAKRHALAANGALLDARREEGFVRRCHGDLHLANVVLWRGRPTPFDCIEFSERIATIDVAYDLAFLLMDLEVRGLRRLANLVLGRYFARKGGPAILAAMPLMLALRAGVRAKVTAMAVAAQEEAEERSRLAALAVRFLGAAEAFLAPGPAPRLIAVGGLSGTGKTTLATALAPEIGRAPGAVLLRSDIIRKRLAGVMPECRLPADAYTAEAGARVYATILDEARAALAAGHSVVVDAVFAGGDMRRDAESAARDAGAGFHGLWLEAPDTELLARVGGRGADASDATPEVVEKQLTYQTGPITWSRLDAGQGPEKVLRQARRAIADT